MGWQNDTVIIILPGGSSTGARIVIDGTRDAIFEYDAANHLVASMAASAGTDDLGNAYLAGITSYVNDGVTGHRYFANLNSGAVEFGAIDLPTVSTGSVNWFDDGGGLYELLLSSGAGAGTHDSEISLVSESAPGANNAFISLVTDLIELLADVDVNGTITATNIRAGTAQTPAPGAGGGTSTVPVVFSQPMPTTPRVTIAPVTTVDPNPATGVQIVGYVDARTTAGFTIRAYRSSNSPTNWDWSAIANSP